MLQDSSREPEENGVMLAMHAEQRRERAKAPIVKNGKKNSVWVYVALLLCAGQLWTLIGCDAVAEVRFEERKFLSPVMLSLGSAGACEETNDQVEMRFVLRDQRSQVIRYGDRLDSVLSVTEESINASFEGGLVYSVPPKLLVRCDSDAEDGGLSSCIPAGGDRCVAYDEAVDNLRGITWDAGSVDFCRRSCASDADCEGGSCADLNGLRYCAFDASTEACNDDDDCPAGGFTCQSSNTGSDLKFCAQSSPLQATIGSLKYVSPRRSSDGEPKWAVSILMDNSGSLNGKGVVDSDNSSLKERATDRQNYRIASMRSFLTLLSDTDARPWKKNMALSLWSFSGETSVGVKPRTGDVTSGNPFVVSTAALSSELTKLGLEREWGRSNVFVALETVAENFGQNMTQDREKAIILFTDGPDDSVVIEAGADEATRTAGLEQWNRNLENALTELQAQEIKVYIVHLDTAIGPKGLEKLQPDPRNANPYPRDADGRTGPLDEYSRIACATGGEYLYVKRPEGLGAYMTLMADYLGGLWSADVAVETMSRVGLEQGPYQLGSILNVKLGGNEDNFFLSPSGSPPSLNEDNRAPIFKRDGVDRANTNLGGVLSNTALDLPPVE